MMWALLAALLVVAIGVLAWFARHDRGLPRSAREVADILKQFLVGEPTGFWADDFIHIPIADPQLEQLRGRFEELANRQVGWEPQAPFPERGRAELEQLIAEAEALADGAIAGALDPVDP